MPDVVLGSKNFTTNGEGWGTQHPATIYNGGDPSGHVTHISWRNWGQSVALATGLNAIFKPQGGYYSQLATISLRASDMGTCTPDGPRAYLKLSVRFPSRPGGPLGPWQAWSEAKNLCSITSGTPASPNTSSASTASPPPAPASPEPHTFTGNGVQSLGTISVAAPSTLSWSCPGCSIFSVTGSAEGGSAIVIDSQHHTSGVSAVEPGTYHSVDVQAYAEGGVAGKWAITITPR